MNDFASLPSSPPRETPLALQPPRAARAAAWAAALCSGLFVLGCAHAPVDRVPKAQVMGAAVSAIPWRDLPLDDALAIARAEDRRVLVLFVARFAPASQTLERATLCDGRVGPLILARTVPLRCDIASNPELARRFRVRELPAVLLLDASGAEIERWTGPQEAADFAARFQAALGGSTAITRAHLRAERARSDKERLHLGRQLAKQGRYDEALAEYRTILRDNLPASTGDAQPGGDTRRRSDVSFASVARSLGALQAAHPPARQALLELRDALREAMLARPQDRELPGRFVAIWRVTADDHHFLDTFRALPAGAARDALTTHAFAILRKQRDYEEAAGILARERVLEQIRTGSDLPLLARGVGLVVFGPLAPYAIHLDREQKLAANVGYFEVYAGARRDPAAGEIARMILRHRKTRSAVEALCTAARRARPDDHSAFIEALGIPALVAEERRRLESE